MSTLILLYVYTVMSNIADMEGFAVLWGIGSVIYAAVKVITTAINVDEDSKENERGIAKAIDGVVSKIYKNFICPLGLVVFLAMALCPDKKDLIFIAGGAATYNLSQTEEAQKLPDNILKALNTFLEGISEEE